MDHFFALLLPLKNPKNQNFEKMKKIAGDIISHSHQKPQSYELRFLRYEVRQT